jgi:nicotinate-nucleotide adenylyltransferase
MNEPIGILGGTFDPIHLGHLRIAEEVADALGLAQVRLIPSGTPPHRAPPLFSAAQRLRFCELSAHGNPRFVVDAREVNKTTPSYTIETLLALKTEFPKRPLVLILGADAFLGLHKWHRWTELLQNAHIALVARPGYEIVSQLPDELRALFAARFVPQHTYGAIRERALGSILPVNVTPLDISATKIRGLLEQQKSVRYLVADTVARSLQAGNGAHA